MVATADWLNPNPEANAISCRVNDQAPYKFPGVRTPELSNTPPIDTPAKLGDSITVHVKFLPLLNSQMDKTSSRMIATIVPAAAADPGAQPPAEEALAARRRRAALAVACLLRVVAIVLFASSAAPSAWRVRRDPVEVAVVAGPTVLLAALFVCLHRAERLAPGWSPGERRRLHVAVWALSTLIFCLTAYQVSRAMSGAPAIAVWSVMAFFVVGGFYALVLRQDQQYQELDGVDRDADAATTRDSKAFKTARPDELV